MIVIVNVIVKAIDLSPIGFWRMGENRGKEKAVNVKKVGGEAPAEATEPTEKSE